MENTQNYSIQIDIKDATPEFRAFIYRILNHLSLQYPESFTYKTLEQ